MKPSRLEQLRKLLAGFSDAEVEAVLGQRSPDKELEPTDAERYIRQQIGIRSSNTPAARGRTLLRGFRR